MNDLSSREGLADCDNVNRLFAQFNLSLIDRHGFIGDSLVGHPEAILPVKRGIRK